MVTFTSTMVGASASYLKYIYQAGTLMKKTDRYMDSTFLDFALAPVDASFVKLTRGSYIVVSSTLYPKWFTGSIINDPELRFLGPDPITRNPVFGYVYKAVSDEYILSLKSIGVVAPFVNTTAGAIIKALVQRLVPNTFNMTNVQDGPFIAQFVIDPTSKFADVVKTLCDSSAYAFWGNDMKLHFQAQDSTGGLVALDAHNTNFTPSRLQMKPATQPVINDVIALGYLEPQDYVTEYFIGTGFTGSFPLASTVFGSDTNVLIDETFGSSISNAWVVFDAANTKLQVLNGYLNVLGGSSNASYDVSVQSAQPLPMEGKLRLTHGEWDFISGTGIFGGLWTGQPNSSYTGCLYGLKFNGTTVSPIAGGALDSTQSATISTNGTKRYVFRTVAEFTRYGRAHHEYNYLSRAGSVQTLFTASAGDNAIWTTIISEIDITTGKVSNQWTFRNTSTLAGRAGRTGTNDAYATYVCVASDSLHATVTGITVSVPINATLETATLLQANNLDFQDWVNAPANTTMSGGRPIRHYRLVPAGWINPTNVAQSTTVVNAGLTSLQMSQNGSLEQDVSALVQPNTAYTIAVEARVSTGADQATNQLHVVLYGTGLAETGLVVVIHDQGLNPWGIYSGVLTTGLSTIPSDLKLKVYNSGGNTGDNVYVDNIVILSAWQQQLIGPNEIDAVDGLSPAATIVVGNSGAASRNSYTGALQYNPGQSQLVFFKDAYSVANSDGTTTFVANSTVPSASQVIRLSYRSAGPAAGRAASVASIISEASKWGDDGLRTVVRKDLEPRPRTTAECELAAAAIVSENSFQHYEGQYEQFSEYFGSEPRAGSVITFANLADLPGTQAEEINEVISTLVTLVPERWSHLVSFGKPDHIRRFLSTLQSPLGGFLSPNLQKLDIVPVEVDVVGLTHADDVVKPFITTWNSQYVNIDCGQNLPSLGQFEARYTDDSWGVDDAKNLLVRTTSRMIQVPRNERGRIIYIRQVNPGNYVGWSEDLTQNNWSRTGVTVTQIQAANPLGGYGPISRGVFSSGGVVSQLNIGLTSGLCCLSCWVKGPAGTHVTLTLNSTSTPFVLTGYWQQLYVTATVGSTITQSLTANAAATIQVTRFSLEQGTAVPQQYTRTTGTLYGPLSRYSTMVHVGFPAAAAPVTIDTSAMLIQPTY